MITLKTRATAPATTERASCRVVIANYSGYIVGDDAIFEALLATIYRAYGRAVIVDALTAMPRRTRERYAVDEVDHVYEYLRSRASRRRVREMIARADLLVIGGGDIVEGQLAQLVLVALATLLGTPVLYAGVGVLLPSARRRQQMLRWSAGQARYIATRDTASENVLRNLGVRGRTLQTLTDLAVDLEQPELGDGKRLLAEAGIVQSRPYVALNLRPPDAAQYAMDWSDSEYAAIVGVCRDLVDREGCDIVCVPLVSSAARPPLPPGTPADDELMLVLAAWIGRPDRVHVLRGDYRPREIAALLSEADLALGMRLHFLLLAATCGTPFVGLSYARKVRAFMQSVGLERFCLDVAGLDAKALDSVVVDARAQRHELARGLATWRDDARIRLRGLDSALVTYASEASSRPRVRQIVAGKVAQVLLSTIHWYGRLREG
jgi:polysaccharide pyruvyl transferase WcaK-like protein